MNQITGPELVHLQGCRHLQTIMLGANKIEKIEDLIALKGMKQLFQINLLGNPIQTEAGYRNKVFDMFPSLTVLDGLDKGGKDAFNATSMVNTTSRVPSTLFDTSAPVISPSISHPYIHKRSISKKPEATKAIAPPHIAPKAGKSGKSSKITPSKGSRTMSSRAGLVFPVGRIRRHLKENDTQHRISKGSSIYMAAILEYLTA